MWIILHTEFEYISMLIVLYLQGVKLQGTIGYGYGRTRERIWTCDVDITNTYNINDKLEEVKRNRAALNV